MTSFQKTLLCFILVSVICMYKSSAQTSISPTRCILWKGVKICEFEYAGYSDTLETCNGEWIVKGKAKNLSGLSKCVLNKIIKPVKKSKCDIVYVDLKSFWGTKEEWPNRIYCLGLITKLKK